MKRIIIAMSLVAVTALSLLAFTGCGESKHYCSYGGCMREVEHEGDRCSAHKGLENDPNYGIPDAWKTN